MKKASEDQTGRIAPAAGANRSGGGTPPWAELGDEDLLNWRICDLKLRIEGSELLARVSRLHEELEHHGIRFRPRCYLATEWLCPDKVPAVGLPFCLAHPRLRQLEQSMMLEVEGGTDKTCMQLLRHETGHALNYAYRLYRRTRWRELFGPFSSEYNVREYYPRPYSRQFVSHLPDHYAQAHPDEDFAETFAVWMTPGLKWREKYRDWPALRKLLYVDHLVNEIATRPPEVPDGPLLWPVSRVRSTLRTYYRRKRQEWSDAYPGYYDPDLRRLFADEGEVRAARFLSEHRRHLVRLVAHWTRARKYNIDELLRRLIRRSRELSLYLKEDDQQALVTLGVYLATMVCDRRYNPETKKGGQNSL